MLNSPQCRLGLPVSPLGPAGNGGNPTQYQAGHMTFKTGRTVSPLEVELNSTLWMPASISFNAGSAGSDPIHRGELGRWNYAACPPARAPALRR